MSNSELVKKFDKILIHKNDFENQWFWVWVRFFSHKYRPNEFWKKAIKKALGVHYRQGGKRDCEMEVKMLQDEGELPKCDIVVLGEGVALKDIKLGQLSICKEQWMVHLMENDNV